MSDSGDRIKGALEALLRTLFSRVDYLALYPAKVVAQNSDGTLELTPDDSRVPGLSKVPVRYGLPGVQAKVAAGARVLLGFSGGDPGAPVATLWEPGSLNDLTVAASSSILLGSATASQAAIKGTDFANALTTLLTALSTYATGIQAVADPTNAATPALAAAIAAISAALPSHLSAKIKLE